MDLEATKARVDACRTHGQRALVGKVPWASLTLTLPNPKPTTLTLTLTPTLTLTLALTLTKVCMDQHGAEGYQETTEASLLYLLWPRQTYGAPRRRSYLLLTTHYILLLLGEPAGHRGSDRVLLRVRAWGHRRAGAERITPCEPGD